MMLMLKMVRSHEPDEARQLEALVIFLDGRTAVVVGSRSEIGLHDSSMGAFEAIPTRDGGVSLPPTSAVEDVSWDAAGGDAFDWTARTLEGKMGT